MKKMLIPFVIAVIHRDMAEKLPVEVHPHELPILEQVHNGKTVEVSEKAKATQPPRELDPVEEYERMIRKYGDDPKAGIPYVERIFGRPRDFARALEQTAVDAEPEPEIDEDLDEQDTGANGGQSGPNPLTAELEGLTKPQLVELAIELDIPGASGMNKAQLVENILEKRELILADQGGADTGANAPT